MLLLAPPVNVRVAVNVMPGDVALLVRHVAKEKFIWLEQLKASVCYVLCRSAEKQASNLTTH